MVSVEEALARIERDARVTERHHLTVAWGKEPELGYVARLSAASGTSALVIPGPGPLTPDDLVWHVEHFHHTLLEELWTLHLDTAWPACLFCPFPHPMRVAAEEGELWWTCPRAATQRVRVGQYPARSGGWRRGLLAGGWHIVLG